MPTIKYDWELIKIHYLFSDIMGVSKFLSRNLKVPLKDTKSGNFKRHTKGWYEDKLKHNIKLVDLDSCKNNFEDYNFDLMYPELKDLILDDFQELLLPELEVINLNDLDNTKLDLTRL